MKLTETNGSYKAVFPKHEIKKLGWQHGQKLKCKRIGKRLIIEVEEDQCQK